jgi:hypothetical protein
MQSIGFLGPALFLTLLSKVRTPAMAVLCMACSQGSDAFSQSGLYSNHQDIGPRYAVMLSHRLLLLQNSLVHNRNYSVTASCIDVKLLLFNFDPSANDTMLQKNVGCTSWTVKHCWRACRSFWYCCHWLHSSERFLG